MPKKDWPKFRKYMVLKSLASNPGLNPELTAYTPGETVALFRHPIIRSWHKKVVSYVVPSDFDSVVFVPCAKSKPWNACRRGLYKSYNQLQQEHDNVYFVTISEPLGIVPQDLWGSFPQYDNPGLFRDLAQRTDMFTSDWKRLFGHRYLTPFDPSAYEQAISILSEVIKKFVANQRRRLKYVSFVEDRPFSPLLKHIGTHSDMLSRAGVVDPEMRFTKRAAPRQEPYGFLKQTLQDKGFIKMENYLLPYLDSQSKLVP